MAHSMVESRLAACVQVIPIQSTFRWKKKINCCPEWLVCAKTRRPLIKQLMALIKSIHPYQVPEIIVIPVSRVSPDYLKWVLEETGA